MYVVEQHASARLAEVPLHRVSLFTLAMEDHGVNGKGSHTLGAIDRQTAGTV